MAMAVNFAEAHGVYRKSATARVARNQAAGRIDLSHAAEGK